MKKLAGAVTLVFVLLTVADFIHGYPGRIYLNILVLWVAMMLAIVALGLPDRKRR